MTWEEIIGLSLTLLVMLVALIGNVMPGIPGTPLALIAAVAHRLYFGQSSVNNLEVVVLILLTVIALVLDYLSSAMGAKKFGRDLAGNGWSGRGRNLRPVLRPARDHSRSVGVMEHVDLFFRRLAAQLGVRLENNPPHENIQATKYGMNPDNLEFVAAIEPLIKYDRILYENAKNNVLNSGGNGKFENGRFA